MRFDFDRQKSWDVKRKLGVSLQDAQEIFDQAYLGCFNNPPPAY